LQSMTPAIKGDLPAPADLPAAEFGAPAMPATAAQSPRK
jgi:hypothetical protein